MRNFNDKINLIWQIAESLRNVYKPEKYGDVILPMCVIRRFDSIVSKDHRETLEKYNELKEMGLDEETLESLLIAHLDRSYYNISNFTFESLINDSENITANFKEYINGFSSNVKDIISHFGFLVEIDKLDKHNALYNIVKEFEKVDFHPESVSNQEMGYIFEELIRRFKENAEAGDHYTPREVIELCMEMLFQDMEEFIKTPGKIVSIADFCAGTGGMLSTAEKKIHDLNPTAIINLYGQELNDESYAICKADMLIKGQDPENIVFGNTLTEDGHGGKNYRLLISNPPFGVQWKNEEKFVKNEFETLGFNGRFGAGVPRVSDGSMLFLLNMISKMYNDENGSRIAIIFNGSPLFTGDAGSGESNIRKWIIENDLLEGLIALPTDMFYNTGIATYIWVLSNRKSEKRKGKIQLVNATSFGSPMRKSLGSKRKEISRDSIKEIKKIYADFSEGEFSKIFDNEDFGYRKVTIERPLKLKFLITPEVIGAITEAPFYQKLDETQKDELISLIDSFDKEKVYMSRDLFLKDLNSKIKDAGLTFIKAAQIKNLISIIGVQDDEAEICKDAKGNIEADTSLRDSESIPLKEDVTEYFNREVLPHVSDAWIDETTLDKIGYEIPFTRHFYKYEELRPFADIMNEIEELEKEIASEIHNIFN
ncbi:type I restriction-modification system subunit M [Cetobacterium sp.]|uniref:type I restriction-modification system subunit M n=1 Tax=Cetobacterium sp. TaxID=2071632 RepID=UPI003F38C2FD